MVDFKKKKLVYMKEKIVFKVVFKCSFFFCIKSIWFILITLLLSVGALHVDDSFVFEIANALTDFY